ncbi:MAG: type II toxin-antitoxin system VapC family toxin [Candidatus Competibacteraceae bacterium]|nr:type II toxin-antitoxin system VapC family toxin [Candidatus Competibacteraceae bacterium]
MGVSFLIDTHILLWWLFDDPKLDESVRALLREPTHSILVSAASAWEIATKYRIGKLPEARQLVEGYPTILAEARFIELPITVAHALKAGSLPIIHRDPFDRMLLAQATLESLPLISYDSVFQGQGIPVIPIRT